MSKTVSATGVHRMPILSSIFPIEKPSKSRSTMSAEILREREFGSVTAKTVYSSATPPLVVHFFSPVMTKSSPSLGARVFMAPASEPAVFSDKQKAMSRFPAAMSGR